MNIILHVDINSAYLSISVAHMLNMGQITEDYRKVPSAVAGGIILAASKSAKKQYGIHSGMPTGEALTLCPNLIIIRPDYRLYQKASKATMEIINRYGPISQFSIDEAFCFLGETNIERAIEIAREIRSAATLELDLTLSVGIGRNRITAKCASDMAGHNCTETLITYEDIKEKLHPLPVRELFGVGAKTEKKLNAISIYTIGDLANFNTSILQSHFKSYALVIQGYANGHEISQGASQLLSGMRSVGAGSTSSYNIDTYREAELFLLSLCETVAMRLRSQKLYTGLITVSITYALNNGRIYKESGFRHLTHQRKLEVTTNSTTYIQKIAYELLVEAWDGPEAPIRKLSVRLGDLYEHQYSQISIFSKCDFDKQQKIDRSIDQIREKFGNLAVYRACLLHSGMPKMAGGMPTDDYPIMSNDLHRNG